MHFLIQIGDFGVSFFHTGILIFFFFVCLTETFRTNTIWPMKLKGIKWQVNFQLFLGMELFLQKSIFIYISENYIKLYLQNNLNLHL